VSRRGIVGTIFKDGSQSGCAAASQRRFSPDSLRPKGVMVAKAQVGEEQGMAIEIKQLHPLFVGEITGLDTANMTPETVDLVENAMAQYAVCVIRNASLSDEDHLRFARAFGPLELAPPNNGRIAAGLYDISNLTAEGEITPPNPDGPQAADFELFHTDSPFNSLPTKWSMLLCYITPPEGANTDYIDTRAVYDDLPRETKDIVEDLVVEHDLFRALQRNGVEFGDEQMRKSYPRMSHPLVRTSASGRKALYMGWHGVKFVDRSEEQSRQLLDELYAFATQPKYIYSHKWRPGDLVIWDNRCSMHSATPFERFRYRRDLRRATINESGPEVSAIEANKAAAAT
jgi:alpha-ketoglutarate-dependent 2,4-dichlorophenoxyacetate dioxygenase